jgi:hypothetical protein
MPEMWGRLQPSPEGTPGFSPPMPRRRPVRGASGFRADSVGRGAPLVQYLEAGRAEARGPLWGGLKPAPPCGACPHA